MREGFRNLRHSIRTKDGRSAGRSAILCAFFFASVCGVTGRAGAQAPDALRVPVTSIGPGLQFAIADFDGDHRPDIAYVPAGQGSPGNNSYCVDFQLSSKGRSCFHLLAPSGGLFVEARDVNGDHAIDLVVSTAWFRRPVAVLLNDGHGSFTAAIPAAFPDAFQQTVRTTFYAQQRAADPIGALTQSRLGVCTETLLPHPFSATRFRSLASVIFLPSHFFSNHGRDPPTRS
jgi:hypothetical protein